MTRACVHAWGRNTNTALHLLLLCAGSLLWGQALPLQRLLLRHRLLLLLLLLRRLRRAREQGVVWTDGRGHVLAAWCGAARVHWQPGLVCCRVVGWPARHRHCSVADLV